VGVEPWTWAHVTLWTSVTTGGKLDLTAAVTEQYGEGDASDNTATLSLSPASVGTGAIKPSSAAEKATPRKEARPKAKSKPKHKRPFTRRRR
jgi:hypothetical protein